MKRFKNILFYADGPGELNTSLRRAVNLAESNHARLTLVDAIEPYDTPEEVAARFDVEWTDLLKSQRQHELEEISSQFQQEDSLIYNKVLVGVTFIEIIKLVISGGYDLLIKVARPAEGIGEKLFGSEDLHLLRKCPCPVLIDRPESTGRYEKVLAAVEIDPSSIDSCDNLIMELATSLSQRELAHLDVVHAWYLQGESYFRSGRFRLPEAELDLMLKYEEDVHQENLDNLLSAFGLSVHDNHVHLKKGRPARVINEFAMEHKTDIIVMGTVGRVGIPGLFIGNTAEEILQTTKASVLAVKPDRFVSPVQ